MMEANTTNVSEPPWKEPVIIGVGSFVATLFIFAIIGVIILCCKCGKRKKQDVTEARKSVNLDEIISKDDIQAEEYINEAAVRSIKKKKKLNLKKIIGYSLAKQVRALVIDSDRLTIGEQLGEGNFGVVHKGSLTCKRDGSSAIVAIKSIMDENVTQKVLVEFIEEILRMRHFQHPNVLKLLGLVIENNIPKIILPYMANGDLKSYMAKERNRLAPRDLLNFARQVADGMTYLSNQHFIHRDLATRNCMVDFACNVVVADFGMARDLFNDDYYTQGEITPIPLRWMAIESILHQKFSTKSDVWSFGVLLWELFTLGLTPYSGIDNNTVIKYIKSGERLKVPSNMPSHVGILMQSCWNLSTSKRPTFPEISDQIRFSLEKNGSELSQKNLYVNDI